VVVFVPKKIIILRCLGLFDKSQI